MNLHLAGKRVLVTGSSRGIGLGIARAFAREGCRVMLNGRNHAALSTAAKECGAHHCVADVTQPSEPARLVAETVQVLSGLDILICNVGSGRSVLPGQETYEEWLRMLHINFFSVTNMVEAARATLAQSGGAIVCISSICGVNILPGAPLPYTIAKTALNAYVKGIARPLGQHSIRINAIAPGNVLFPGSVWEAKVQEDTRAVQAMLEREVALARLGQVEEIANLALFLASANSAFTTGAVFVVDGGQVR